MTSLIPVINSSYDPIGVNAAYSYSFLPVVNSERPLYATAVYDINTPAQTGQVGATYIKDTSTHNDESGWYAIQILTDTKFAGLTSNWNGNSPIGETFAKDHVVYGNFTSIQLESGSVLAYKL